MAKTCYSAKNDGPLQNPMGFAFVTHGNETRLHNVWTPKKIVQAFFIVVIVFAGWILYAEARYRFAPSAYFNTSAVADLIRFTEREIALFRNQI